MRAARPRSFLIISAWVLGIAVAAQNLAVAERLPIKTYTTADGLGHNNVNRIVRDSRSFLWFCTFEGLARFDGYTFTTYGIAHGLPSRVVNYLRSSDISHFAPPELGSNNHAVSINIWLLRSRILNYTQPAPKSGLS